MRCRPPKTVAEEFLALDHDLGAREVYVVDSQFNRPIEHAKSVCDELIGRRDNLGLRWTCMLNPGDVDEELVLKLKVARCQAVDLGIDSASDLMLGRLGKGFTTGEVARTIGLLHEYRLSFTAWILLGGPGETESTIEETLEFLVSHDVENVLFGIGLRVCPGTRLESLMRDEGSLGPGCNLLDPAFYLSMDAETMVDLVRPQCEERSSWHIAALQ